MPWKFRDDISNGSGVIVLTNNRVSHKQTEQKTIPSSLRYAARVVNAAVYNIIIVITIAVLLLIYFYYQ